jgi:hypothetical protein
MASYYDAVARGLPQNCAVDFATAIKFFDSTVASNDAKAVSQIKNDADQAVTSDKVSVADSDADTPGSVGENLYLPFNDFQVCKRAV